MMALSPAQAQARALPSGIIVGAVITATVVTAAVLLGGSDNNDDEGPQSP